MFQLIDKDKSGDLSYDEVAHLIELMHPCYLCYLAIISIESKISKEEAYTLI